MKLFEKSLCRMKSVVVLFSYPIRLSISKSKTKILSKNYGVILTDFSMQSINRWRKFRFKNTSRKSAV